MSSQPPEGEDKRKFRLIEGGALPDNVLRAQRWCEEHPGTRIEFTDGWYTCFRGSEVLAAAPDDYTFADDAHGLSRLRR
jgi:hypothetical protein